MPKLFNSLPKNPNLRALRRGELRAAIPIRGIRCSTGVSPAVAAASRSGAKQAFMSRERVRIETDGGVHEGAGRMPAPQRAGRPRYIRWIGSPFHVAHSAIGQPNTVASCRGVSFSRPSVFRFLLTPFCLLPTASCGLRSLGVRQLAAAWECASLLAFLRDGSTVSWW